ncbi:DUF910 family protein [Ornithinibacillus gellani]|uniref:YqgQ family protein n=1 Tax=Ornithinibacillus gellani TaxID=2293253 RepID=UPI000F4A8CB4|nr:YqgQ family protein [Ornithinibacillus gellani]TQS74546.1 DUF910 family protein [Ornithinibacillus gellani]
MKNMYDVQQLLKRFGIFIYVGNRTADLELMEMEVRELYQSGCIQIQEYQQAVLILKKEIRLAKSERE